MKRVVHALALILTMCCFAACSQEGGKATTDPQATVPVPNASIPLIEKGMSIDQLRDAVHDSTPWRYRFLDEEEDSLTESMRLLRDMEHPIQHEFTTSEDGRIVTCVAAQLLDGDRSLQIMFVFRDGQLENFLPVPPFRFEQVGVHDGAPVVEPIIEPEVRIREILEAEGMSGQSLADYLKRTAEEAIASRREHSEPLWPAAEALIRLSQPSDSEHARQISAYFKQIEKFDGLKVKLGMSAAEVHELFGDPIATEEYESGTRQLFGFRAPAVQAGIALPLVLVEFVDGKVERVFSGEFIDVEHYLGRQR
jgi:hypothetical protein